MAECSLYFAYGSNINLNQMAYRCPDASVVGPVTLENYELLFRLGGYATIMPCEGGKVHGLLWSLTPDCERSLDQYEGCPYFYDKRTVTVRDGMGREQPVMAYIMDERFREPRLPSSIYYNGILEGYQQNGLPVAALKKAWDHAVQEVQQETKRANASFANTQAEITPDDDGMSYFAISCQVSFRVPNREQWTDTQKKAFTDHVTEIFYNDESLAERLVSELSFSFHGDCAGLEYSFAGHTTDKSSAESFSEQCVRKVQTQLEGYGCKIEKIECFAEKLEDDLSRAKNLPRGQETQKKKKGNHHER